MMMKPSGRGGQWSPGLFNCQVEMGGDSKDDETVRRRWVVIPKMIVLSVSGG